MLEEYSFDKFDQDHHNWLKTGSTVWFVHGNMLQDDAIELITLARKNMKLKDVALDKLPEQSGTLKLKEGTAILYQ